MIPGIYVPPSNITLDVLSHPYIFSLIIHHSDRNTITTLLRCSKESFKAAAPAIYKHLRISQDSFTKLIELGHAPSKRGSSSGILGRAFSPYLRHGLEITQTLCFTEYYRRGNIPRVPRGCLADVKEVFIMLHGRHWTSYAFSQPAQHLDQVLRISVAIRTVTLIMADIEMLSETKMMFAWTCKLAQRGLSVSLVFTPNPLRWWEVSSWDSLRDSTARYLYYATPSRGQPKLSPGNVLFVGYEYTGTPGQGPMYPAVTNEGDIASKGDQSPTYIRFIDWLDETAVPRGVFTAKVEEAYRTDDVRLRRNCALSQKVSDFR